MIGNIKPYAIKYGKKQNPSIRIDEDTLQIYLEDDREFKKKITDLQ